MDTETTGLGNDDEIIEITVVDLDGRVLLDTLVKPTVPIQQESFEVHGIIEKDVAEAPTFAEIANQLQQVIAGKTVLIYNDSFDNRMVYQSAKKYGLEISLKSNCVMETYAKYYGSFKDNDRSFRRIKLTDASIAEGVNECQTHRAGGDCHLVRGLINSISK
ncbi:3'-5' exonuclease [Brevibacillus laterosporus]|uniref:3'-5' exonuclease n=1 Tax=Brevibacillus laterosporus TaxID=1465 RepID=UPI0013C4DCEE|nr:3'-5' exonuclease [Brevibacillus laterosporus]